MNLSTVFGTCPAPKQLTTSHIKRWLHHHPVVQKALVVALAVLGLKTLSNGITRFSKRSIYAGVTLLASTYLIKKITPYILPTPLDPAKHVFTSQYFRGVTLKYEGDLPVLTIPREVDAHDAGFARGYIMAEQINKILDLDDFEYHGLRSISRENSIFLTEVKKRIPPHYLSELEGIVQGYQVRKDSWIFSKANSLTIDKLLYFHLFLDNGLLNSRIWIGGTDATGPIVALARDWTSFNLYGTYSFIEMRETSGGIRTISESFPLFIGCFSAINDKGLFGTINVTHRLIDSPENSPCVFYLRQLIESCGSIKGEQGAEAFWLKQSPLGSFNLTLADTTNAVKVEFDRDNKSAPATPCWSPDRDTQQIKEMLRNPAFSTETTISAAYIEPRQAAFEISFDNGYAGDRTLSAVPMNWFNKT